MSETFSNITVHNLRPRFKKELLQNKLRWLITEIYDFEILFDSEEYDFIDRVPMSQTYKQPKNLKSDLEFQQQS